MKSILHNETANCALCNESETARGVPRGMLGLTADILPSMVRNIADLLCIRYGRKLDLLENLILRPTGMNVPPYNAFLFILQNASKQYSLSVVIMRQLTNLDNKNV
jgi:hypothetical protein